MRQELRDFFADLITDQTWSPTTLGNLFSQPPGTWISVSSLCGGLHDAKERYRSLHQDGETDTTVTWLPHPIQPGQAFLLLFYADDEMTSSVAIVTDAYLHKMVPGIREESQEEENAVGPFAGHG